jgi:phosphatidylglycerol---prolipoprotein diacylglyceryl transferase
MDPILFHLGPLPVYANATFFFFGCLAGFWVSSREAARLGTLVGYSKRNMLIFFSGAIPFAYLLGRLNAWIFNPEIERFGCGFQGFLNAGFLSFGAILGAFLYAFGYVKIRNLNVGEELDLVALTMPLIESIYRIGCLLNGCCYGRETNSVWGLYLPDTADHWVFRYPTQIFLIFFNLILFLFLWQRRKKKSYSGSQTHIFLAVYCIGRILIDGLRGDLHGFQFLNYQQVGSLIILLGTILHLLVTRFFPLKKIRT